MCPLIGHSDREKIYIGDNNDLTLEVSAENQGEGAYEAELHVYPPQQADFTEVVRSQVNMLHLPIPSKIITINLLRKNSLIICFRVFRDVFFSFYFFFIKNIQ